MSLVIHCILAFLMLAVLPPFAGKPKEAPKKSKITLYTPHKGQRKIHRSKARFRVIACGRRYGKTLLACNEIVKYALDHKDSNCAWVAPWFRQSKIAYRFMRRAFAKSEGILVRKSDSDLRLEFANGSVIQFFSAENDDSIRGEGYDFLVIDEAGDALKDPKIWTDVIRAALSDRNGKALIIGTPKGRNLFFQLFNRGEDPAFPEWESFHAATADNPYIPKAEIEAAKQELPEDAFWQEFCARFLEYGAGVFKQIDACLNGLLLDPEYQRVPGHSYVIGFDPAKYEDFSVVTLIDCHTKQVVGWLRINQIDYTVQLEMVAAIANKFGAHVLMDMTGVGDPLLEQLITLGNKGVVDEEGRRVGGFTVEGYLFTNASKKALIESLQLGIQNRDIGFPDIPVMIAELRMFEYVMTKARQLSYSAPRGQHDDAVISLALAYMTAKQPRGPIMWSVGENESSRTLEMAELPENKQYSLVEIEKYIPVSEDEGDYFESEGY